MTPEFQINDGKAKVAKGRRNHLDRNDLINQTLNEGRRSQTTLDFSRGYINSAINLRRVASPSRDRRSLHHELVQLLEVRLDDRVIRSHLQGVQINSLCLSQLSVEVEHCTEIHLRDDFLLTEGKTEMNSVTHGG